MKRFAAMALVCALALTACGSQAPDLAEIQQALQDGSLTVEYAVEQGWVTQQWADDYLAQQTVPAGDKLRAGAIGDFSTTTLSGEPFTQAQLAAVTLFVFVDPIDPNAEALYQALTEGAEGVTQAGAQIVLCTKRTDGNEWLSDAPFPVIHYNDSLQAATQNHQEMIEGQPNIASWCVNQSFLSAWFSAVDAQGLADTAASFVEMQAQMTSQPDGMAVMG